MAVYTPPTENLPIFNAAVFINPPSIDSAFLNANYLKFPTAQGAETLQATNHLGLATFTGGIIQTDSTYTNNTVSTGEATYITGGQIQNTQGNNNTTLTSTQLIVNDATSAFTNGITILNSNINYENNSGNADQLLISSNITDNPILIQSTGSTVYGGGITLNTATMGADIILETTSSLFPTTASSIQLITNTTATLGTQSSIILDTDVVFVMNGAMRILNDRTNFTTGLSLYEITANNFAITNSAGSLQLGSNIVLSGSTTTISNPLTPTYSGSAPTATQIGYTINTNLSGTAVLPPTANVSANMNAGIVIPNGIWFISIIANVNYTVVGATTSYFALSLSQSSGNMDAQNRNDFVAGLRTGDIYFNFPLIVNSTGGTYYIVGVQQGGTKTLSSLNYKITRIA